MLSAWFFRVGLETGGVDGSWGVIVGSIGGVIGVGIIGLGDGIIGLGEVIGIIGLIGVIGLVGVGVTVVIGVIGVIGGVGIIGITIHNPFCNTYPTGIEDWISVMFEHISLTIIWFVSSWSEELIHPGSAGQSTRPSLSLSLRSEQAYENESIGGLGIAVKLAANVVLAVMLASVLVADVELSDHLVKR